MEMELSFGETDRETEREPDRKANVEVGIVTYPICAYKTGLLITTPYLIEHHFFVKKHSFLA